MKAPNFNISGNVQAVDYDDDFSGERKAIEDRRLNLAKELEEETNRRSQAEDQLQMLKDEFMKKELEDSRTKSEILSRIEQLELEK